MSFVSVEVFVAIVAVMAIVVAGVTIVAVMAVVAFVIVVSVVSATRLGLVGRGRTRPEAADAAEGRRAPLSAGHVPRGGGRGGRATWHPVCQGGLFSSGRRLGHRHWQGRGLRNTVQTKTKLEQHKNKVV